MSRPPAWAVKRSSQALAARACSAPAPDAVVPAPAVLAGAEGLGDADAPADPVTLAEADAVGVPVWPRPPPPAASRAAATRAGSTAHETPGTAVAASNRVNRPCGPQSAALCAPAVPASAPATGCVIGTSTLSCTG